MGRGKGSNARSQKNLPSVQAHHARGGFKTEIFASALNENKKTVLPDGKKMKDAVLRWFSVDKIPSEMLNRPEVTEIIRRSNRDYLIEVVCISELANVLGVPGGVYAAREFLSNTAELGGTVLVLDNETKVFVLGGERAKMDHSKSALVVLDDTNTIRKGVDCSEQLRKDRGCADPVKYEEHLRTMVRFR